jgi:hypothetical protein
MDQWSEVMIQQPRLCTRQESQEKAQRWAVFFLILLLGYFPKTVAQAAGTNVAPNSERIELKDGQFTVRLANASLHRVIDEVGRLSGAEIEIVWLKQMREETVSVEFTALPFVEALERILKEKNFLLVYTAQGEEGKLAQIWISSSLGEKETPLVHAVAAESSMTLVTSSSTAATLQNDEEAADGQTALSSMTLDDLVQTALGERDQALRLDAISLLGQEIHENPRVKELLSRIAHEDSDPDARQIATLTLGEVAE